MSCHSQIVLLVFMLRILVTVSQVPFEVFSVTNVTAINGRNATLHCPFDNLHVGHRIAWIRYDTRTILSMHGQKVIQSDRYSIDSKENSPYDLIITGIREADAGTYICQINSEPMQNIVINLFVMISPKIVSTEPSDEVVVEAGQSVTLSCTAQGTPTPKIMWRRTDGNPLRIIQEDGLTKKVNSYVGSRLALRAVRQTDSGHILCIASNGYPPAISHKFALLVQYKPIVTLKTDRDGETIMISCRIEAMPLPDQAYLSNKGEPLDAERKWLDDHNLELRYVGHIAQDALIKCSSENPLGASATVVPIPSAFADERQLETHVKYVTAPSPSSNSSPDMVLINVKPKSTVRPSLDEKLSSSTILNFKLHHNEASQSSTISITNIGLCHFAFIITISYFWISLAV